MKREVAYTKQFKKDFKRIKKRGKDLAKLEAVVDVLIDGADLPARYRDHALSGTYRGIRDAHIEPDWLLLYRISDDLLVLIRTGTHADLF